MTGGASCGIEAEVAERGLVPFLRLAALVEAGELLIDPGDELRIVLADGRARGLRLRRRRHHDLALAEALAGGEQRRMEQAHGIDTARLERRDGRGIVGEALQVGLGGVLADETVHRRGLRHGDAHAGLVEVFPGLHGQVVARQHGQRIVEQRRFGEVDGLLTLRRGVEHEHDVDLVGLERGDGVAPAHLDGLELGAQRIGHRLAHGDAEPRRPLAGLGILGEPRRRLRDADAEGAALLGLLDGAGVRRQRRQGSCGEPQCGPNQDLAALDRHVTSPFFDSPETNFSVTTAPRRMWSAISRRSASRSLPSAALM